MATNTVINTNVSALNSYRSLSTVGNAQRKSSEKLSTGLRINRAADDAAGLAISEKMRSQIRGLNQASRNSQDGISLIQTAEGAMSTSEEILQRMRVLVDQAANDTNEIEDREKIALELDELSKELDSIAEKTQFNKKTLLNGDYETTKLYFQTGANSDQGLSINIDKMSADALGVSVKDIGAAVADPELLREESVTAYDATLDGTTTSTTIDLTSVGADAGIYEIEAGMTIEVGHEGTVTLTGFGASDGEYTATEFETAFATAQSFKSADGKTDIELDGANKTIKMDVTAAKDTFIKGAGTSVDLADVDLDEAATYALTDVTVSITKDGEVTFTSTQSSSTISLNNGYELTSGQSYNINEIKKIGEFDFVDSSGAVIKFNQNPDGTSASGTISFVGKDAETEGFIDLLQNDAVLDQADGKTYSFNNGNDKITTNEDGSYTFTLKSGSITYGGVDITTTYTETQNKAATDVTLTSGSFKLEDVYKDTASGGLDLTDDRSLEIQLKDINDVDTLKITVSKTNGETVFQVSQDITDASGDTVLAANTDYTKDDLASLIKDPGRILNFQDSSGTMVTFNGNDGSIKFTEAPDIEGSTKTIDPSGAELKDYTTYKFNSGAISITKNLDNTYKFELTGDPISIDTNAVIKDGDVLTQSQLESFFNSTSGKGTLGSLEFTLVQDGNGLYNLQVKDAGVFEGSIVESGSSVNMKTSAGIYDIDFNDASNTSTGVGTKSNLADDTSSIYGGVVSFDVAATADALDNALYTWTDAQASNAGFTQAQQDALADYNLKYTALKGFIDTPTDVNTAFTNYDATDTTKIGSSAANSLQDAYDKALELLSKSEGAKALGTDVGIKAADHTNLQAFVDAYDALVKASENIDLRQAAAFGGNLSSKDFGIVVSNDGTYVDVAITGSSTASDTGGGVSIENVTLGSAATSGGNYSEAQIMDWFTTGGTLDDSQRLALNGATLHMSDGSTYTITSDATTFKIEANSDIEYKIEERGGGDYTSKATGGTEDITTQTTTTQGGATITDGMTLTKDELVALLHSQDDKATLGNVDIKVEGATGEITLSKGSITGYPADLNVSGGTALSSIVGPTPSIEMTSTVIDTGSTSGGTGTMMTGLTIKNNGGVTVTTVTGTGITPDDQDSIDKVKAWFNSTTDVALDQSELSSLNGVTVNLSDGSSYSFEYKGAESGFNVSFSANSDVTILRQDEVAVTASTTAGADITKTGAAAVAGSEDTRSHGELISGLMDKLDTAIEKVSTMRARLGAYQNRLEYTISNLDLSSENLAAAESRIRDTDMAQEMMSLTKSNVLQQASMSMLAQANQAPQNVLQLLQ